MSAAGDDARDGRPLRVLHLLDELRPSGAETMLEVAAPLFAAAGVASEILSIGPNEVGPFAPRLAAAGYRIHHIPFRKSPRFFLRVYDRLRSGYDVVHMHVERAAFWLSLTALAAGDPLILKSIHNCFAFGGDLRLRRKVQRQLMVRLGVKQVAVSPSVRETERSHFGIDAVLVNNWFDAARFAEPGAAVRSESRRALGCSERDVVLVSVANCNAFKNHPELLQALAMLPVERRPLWLHVGGEEPGKPERALARTLGVEDRVRFIGPLGDVRPALYAADAFVMPSLREGLPISALEALATGLPAILADVPGLRDLRPLFAGVVWAEPSAKALAAALLAFTERDPASWREQAREHGAVVRREFGVETGVAAYLRLYRDRA